MRTIRFCAWRINKSSIFWMDIRSACVQTLLFIAAITMCYISFMACLENLTRNKNGQNSEENASSNLVGKHLSAFIYVLSIDAHHAHILYLSLRIYLWTYTAKCRRLRNPWIERKWKSRKQDSYSWLIVASHISRFETLGTENKVYFQFRETQTLKKLLEAGKTNSFSMFFSRSQSAFYLK